MLKHMYKGKRLKKKTCVNVHLQMLRLEIKLKRTSVTRWWEKIAQFTQKVAADFLHKSDIVQNSPKSNQNIWASFVRQFVA